LDSLPPPPPPSLDPPYVFAANDIYPVGPREKELCAHASSPDWLYLGGLAVLDVGVVFANSFNANPDRSIDSPGPWSGFKVSHDSNVRTLGPVTIGLAWGATLGGGYLALPKCKPHWVGTSPREGGRRSSLPIALSLAAVAAITSPFASFIISGSTPTDWTISERTVRLFVAGGFGAAGALLPYLIPPRTWSAAKELERIGVDPIDKGAFLSYTARF
jgi:hypothetical protein